MLEDGTTKRLIRTSVCLGGIDEDETDRSKREDNH